MRQEMLKFKYALAFLISLLATRANCSSNFPADIQRCHAGDTACITRTAMNLVQLHARTGYPAAAFPIIEPFSVKSADISDGRQSSVSLKLHFRDILVEGLSAVKIDRSVGFERDPAKSKFEMHGSFPKIALRGKYSADGRILILPIKGDGDAEIILHRPKFSVKFKPSLYQKNGKTFMNVDKLKVLVEPERMNIKLTNLFNGDRALGDNLNQFLNENWQDVWNELQTSIHQTIAEIVKTANLLPSLTLSLTLALLLRFIDSIV